MSINIYSIPPLAASLVNLFLVGVVLGKGFKNRINQVWAFLSFCLAVWSFGTFMLYISSNPAAAMTWLKVYNFGLVLIPATFVHFAIAFSGMEKKKSLVLAGVFYVISATFLILSYFGLFNPGVQHYTWGYYPKAGSLNLLYDLCFMASPFVVAKVMITDFRRSNLRKKNQYKYVFIAMIVAFVSNVSNFLPIYGNANYPLGHFGILLTALVISFAIIKYQLMDISIIIRKSAIYSVITAIVTAVYVVIVLLLQYAFRGITGNQSIYAVAIVGLIVAITFEPLRRYVQVGIDRLFFKQRLEYQNVLKETGDQLHAEVVPSVIANVFVSAIVNAIRIDTCWLMVPESTTGSFAVVASTNLRSNVFTDLSLGADSPLVRYIGASREPVWLDDPEVGLLRRGADKELRMNLENLGVSLICPLHGKNALIGVLFLGRKKSGEIFNHNDTELIATLATQAAISIENSRLYEELQSSYLNTVKSLVAALEAKDEYTKGHSERVAGYARAIAVEMKMTNKQAQLLYEVSLLHDVGKIGVSEAILNKKSALSSSEMAHIQSHTITGEKILSSIESMRDGLSAVRHHHERLNGMGYPDGLSEVNIPISARILAVADAYDAMTTKRPYRNAMSPREAVVELKNHAGQQFDPKVVRAFISALLRSKTQKGLLKLDEATLSLGKSGLRSA